MSNTVQLESYCTLRVSNDSSQKSVMSETRPFRADWVVLLLAIIFNKTLLTASLGTFPLQKGVDPENNPDIATPSLQQKVACLALQD